MIRMDAFMICCSFGFWCRCLSNLCNSSFRSIGSADSAEHTVGTRCSLSSGRWEVESCCAKYPKAFDVKFRKRFQSWTLGSLDSCTLPWKWMVQGLGTCAGMFGIGCEEERNSVATLSLLSLFLLFSLWFEFWLWLLLLLLWWRWRCGCCWCCFSHDHGGLGVVILLDMFGCVGTVGGKPITSTCRGAGCFVCCRDRRLQIRGNCFPGISKPLASERCNRMEYIDMTFRLIRLLHDVRTWPEYIKIPLPIVRISIEHCTVPLNWFFARRQCKGFFWSVCWSWVLRKLMHCSDVLELYYAN